VSLFSLSKQPAGVRPGPARRWPPLRCFVSPPAPRPPAPARPRPPCRCQWVRVAGVHRVRLRDSQCRRHHPVFRVAVEWAAPSVCIGVAKSLLSVLASLPTVAKFTEQTKNGWPLTQKVHPTDTQPISRCQCTEGSLKPSAGMGGKLRFFLRSSAQMHFQLHCLQLVFG
jgi:hypothetical protein